jgi:hypothetical protein
MTSPTYAPTNEATGTFFFATFPRRHGRQSENCPSAHELDRPDTRFREVERPNSCIEPTNCSASRRMSGAGRDATCPRPTRNW